MTFTSSCSKCCRDIDIAPLDLLFPERLDARGREFVSAHGLFDESIEDLLDNSIVLDNGLIKINHICNQLDQETNLCSIYESRPSICRDYTCSTRTGNDSCTQTHSLKIVRKDS